MNSTTTGIPPFQGGAHEIILCADDYGLTAGVSAAILELAGQERLSATSALATAERWPGDAKRLRAVRDRMAVGLHIDLTLHPPLGRMPVLCPQNRPTTLRRLIAAAFSRRVDPHEIAAEVTRQLDRFESEFGYAPDHVDGHQHVHVLPGVRDGVLAALAAHFPTGGPLIRDPSDHIVPLLRRRLATGKAIVIAMLASRFGAAARAKGFALNTSFSGTSSFDMRTPYANELRAALSLPSRRHLVMCHPGHVDPELARLDPVVGRREQEYAAILQSKELSAMLWRPRRQLDGPSVNWQQA